MLLSFAHFMQAREKNCNNFGINRPTRDRLVVNLLSRFQANQKLTAHKIEFVAFCCCVHCKTTNGSPSISVLGVCMCIVYARQI